MSANAATGALSGGASGAAAGTSIMPGVGTALGALGGGIAGLFSGFGKDKAEKKMREKMKLARQLFREQQQNNRLASQESLMRQIGIMSPMNRFLGSVGGQGAQVNFDPMKDPLFSKDQNWLYGKPGAGPTSGAMRGDKAPEAAPPPAPVQQWVHDQGGGRR